jgi:hypothetical protein
MVFLTYVGGALAAPKAAAEAAALPLVLWGRIAQAILWLVV